MPRLVGLVVVQSQGSTCGHSGARERSYIVKPTTRKPYLTEANGTRPARVGGSPQAYVRAYTTSWAGACGDGGDETCEASVRGGNESEVACERAVALESGQPLSVYVVFWPWDGADGDIR